MTLDAIPYYRPNIQKFLVNPVFDNPHLLTTGNQHKINAKWK